SALYTAHAGSGFSGAVSRGLLAVLCLLPPTVLMGATLPAMSRWIEATPSGVSWLGLFYGGNIAGAVGGCLLAGFYLLRVHDMYTATYVAAAINATVAGIALAFEAISRRRSGVDATSESFSVPAPGADEARPQPPDHGLPAWPVYVAIALSGMTALGAEVVWTRLLSLLMGGTVYTFSIILGVFLIGLGIGSTIGALLARNLRSPRLALGRCQWLLVGGIAWTAAMIAYSLPHWPINPSLALSPWYTFQLDLARGLWTVLPAALLWGASFPIALAAVADPTKDSARLVGGVYAANTVGAIGGALLFSLLIVPAFGTLAAQQLLAALSALSALVLLGWRSRSTEVVDQASTGGKLSGNLFTGGITSLIIVTVTLVAIGTMSPAHWGLVAYGRFMATYGNRLAPEITSEKSVPSSGNPDIYCTYVGEGLNGTIAVTKWTSGIRNFHSAGKVQASSDPRDMRLQRMLGHLSALVHEKPESVLVVACGAGVTAGSFVVHPETKRIVICDIEPLVPQVVAPMFAKENYNVVKDPRTQVVSDDGRHFIRTTQEKFDIITSDPIDPWVKGCAALNTIEYYEMCKAHLNPGGVMSLWVPLYESNAETVKSVVAAFFKVFPQGIIWSNDDNGEGYDAVLFGQAEPTRLDLDRLQARLNRPDHAAVRQSLEEAGFSTWVDLLATYAGQAPDLQEWLADAQINTDRNMRLQYLAGWAANSYMGGEILNGMLKYRQFPAGVFQGTSVQVQRLRSRFRNVPPKDSVSSTGTASEHLTPQH
ncbi:MAG TPA: fused MFS/spermidine synthase, partial [Candidatus Limnocylindria bacterium]|nr:fused MFS/spermidine synthase [Candidatus Limnocylindria bacterium]